MVDDGTGHANPTGFYKQRIFETTFLKKSLLKNRKEVKKHGKDEDQIDEPLPVFTRR